MKTETRIFSLFERTSEEMKKTETFRRAEITSAGVIQFRDVTRTKPNPGEVLIKVKSCALCGSDVHTYKGKHPYVSFPCTFGHELSGVVEELGSSTEKVKIGDRVCVEPLITCGMCYYCLCPTNFKRRVRNRC